jgi:hypothetical protein
MATPVLPTVSLFPSEERVLEGQMDGRMSVNRFETAVFFRQQGCWDEMQENNVDSDNFIIKIVEQHDCQHTGSDRRSSELGRYEVDKIVLDQLSSSALYAEQLIFSSRRASSVLSKQM